MSMSEVLTAVHAISGAIAGILAFRLYRNGLFRRYPALFAYMIFQAPYSIFPWFVSTKSTEYFWFWIVTMPMFWALNILIVRELCGIVLDRHKGFYTLGRWVMYGSVAVSGVLSLLSLLPRMKPAMAMRSRLLWYALGMERGVGLALALFLLLMLLAVSRYPVHLSRNVLLNAFLFTVHFLANTLVSIIQMVFRLRVNNYLDYSMIFVSSACMVVWFLFLTPAGEMQEVSWPRFRADYEKRVLDRLDAINSVLARG
jgi:hypothetical protein